MEQSHVVSAVLRWWWLIIICAAVGATIGFVGSSLLPKQYSSESQILVGSLTVTDPTQQLGYQQLAQTYAALVYTPLVLQTVADELGFSGDFEDLKDMINARSITGQSILRLAATASTPEEAADMASAITAAIVDLSRTDVEIPAATPAPAATGQTIAPPISTPVTVPGPALATVVEAATIPDRASFPSPLLNALVGAMIGTLVGFLLALAADTSRRRRREAKIAAATATSGPAVTTSAPTNVQPQWPGRRT